MKATTEGYYEVLDRRGLSLGYVYMDLAGSFPFGARFCLTLVYDSKFNNSKGKHNV